MHVSDMKLRTTHHTVCHVSSVVKKQQGITASIPTPFSLLLYHINKYIKHSVYLFTTLYLHKQVGIIIFISMTAKAHFNPLTMVSWCMLVL